LETPRALSRGGLVSGEEKRERERERFSCAATRFSPLPRSAAESIQWSVEISRESIFPCRARILARKPEWTGERCISSTGHHRGSTTTFLPARERSARQGARISVFLFDPTFSFNIHLDGRCGVTLGCLREWLFPRMIIARDQTAARQQSEKCISRHLECAIREKQMRMRILGGMSPVRMSGWRVSRFLHHSGRGSLVISIHPLRGESIQLAGAKLAQTQVK